MIVYELEGTFRLKWEDGKYEGDAEVTDLIALRLSYDPRVVVGGMPPTKTAEEVVEDGLFFHVLVKSIFADVKVVQGKVPPPPSVPKGAIP